MGSVSGAASKVPILPRYPDKMSGLMLENFWANKAACDDAERAYYEKLSGCKVSSLTEQIAAARKHIKNSLDSVDNLSSGLSAAEEMALMKKLGALEVENKELKKVTDDLKSLVLSLQARVDKLDGGKAPAPAAKAAPAPAEDDDDVDLFGSDEESDDEEKKRITEERLKAYHEKKAKKPKVIAKTSVLFDVKPWDDETDMDNMLKECKGIEMEGLVWGATKLVPVGYGIQKLQIMCTVEDEKVSIEELSEKMEE